MVWHPSRQGNVKSEATQAKIRGLPEAPHTDPASTVSATSPGSLQPPPWLPPAQNLHPDCSSTSVQIHYATANKPSKNP